MKSLGSTVREIRIQKGFRQKEVYTGILSKSFSIEFEKGRYDLKFTVMIQILERLMVGVEEFLCIVYNHHDAMQEEVSNLDMKRFQSDPEYARQMTLCAYAVYERQKTAASALTYHQLVVLSNDMQAFDVTASRQYIQQYLFDMETWTLSEFRIFSDMNFIFTNTELKIELFRSAWSSLKRIHTHPQYQEYMAHLLTNNVVTLLLAQHYELAKQAIAELQAICLDASMLTWQVPLLFLEGLMMYATGTQKQGKAQIQKAITIYTLCDHQEMVDQLEFAFQQLQDSLSSYE